MLPFLAHRCFVKNHPDSIEWDNIGVRSFSTHAEMDVIISYLHSKKIYGVRKHSPLYVKKMIDAKRLKMPKTLTVVSPYKGRFRNSRPCGVITMQGPILITFLILRVKSNLYLT